MDEVAVTANDLVEKTMVIGPTGVLLLLGAAAVGAAATYYVTQKTKQKGRLRQKPAALRNPISAS